MLSLDSGEVTDTSKDKHSPKDNKEKSSDASSDIEKQSLSSLPLNSLGSRNRTNSIVGATEINAFTEKPVDSTRSISKALAPRLVQVHPSTPPKESEFEVDGSEL